MKINNKMSVVTLLTMLFMVGNSFSQTETFTFSLVEARAYAVEHSLSLIHI